MSWPQIKNVVVSKSHLYFVQQQQTISWLDCDMLQKVDFIQHLTMSNLVAEPRRSSKALPKAKLAPKKSWLLVVCCPPNALQLSESQRKHCIWEVCSANQWDALKTTALAASIVQQKGPNSSPWQYPNVRCTTTCCVNNASKVEWMGLWNFASSAIFTWPLTNWLPLLQESWQLFAWKMFYIQQDAEKAFQEFIESQNMDFYATGINKLIYCWQKCIDEWFLFWLINVCLSLVIMI